MNTQTDQTKLKRLQNRIRARKGLIGCGAEFSVALHSSGKPVYVGNDRWGQGEVRLWSGVSSIACGRNFVVAVMQDGTLKTAGRCPVDRIHTDSLSCVRGVVLSDQHMAVLLNNGRTVLLGDTIGHRSTEDWPAVTDVVCGRGFTAGLSGIGRIAVTGGTHMLRHTLRSWSNVAGLFTDFTGKVVYGITAEGKLLSTAGLPRAVKKWKNLVYVSAYRGHICAVTATGQLLSTHRAIAGMPKAKHFIACAVSDTHAIALTKDGQLIAVGRNEFGQCNTARFGALFTDFDEFSADRRAGSLVLEQTEREYQVRLSNALHYKKRLACGERLTACINADGHVLTTAHLRNARQWSHVRALACGNAHLLALHENGRVSADGNDVDGCTAVGGWENIRSIAAGKYHSLGVTDDGRVLFCGRNDCGQGDVTEWKSIFRVYAADDYTVGLTYEGTLLIAGTPPFSKEILNASWNSPLEVAVTSTHMAAVYRNGRVLSTVMQPASERPGDGEIPNTASWKGVRSIAVGPGVTIGLCFGGRVVAVGENSRGQCETAAWKQIVDIGCGDGYTVGLTSEGRVMAAGSPCSADGTPYSLDIAHWQDVMTVVCGSGHVAAMAGNGQVLAGGRDNDKQCSATAHFSLFRDARQLYGHGQYNRQIEKEIQANRAAEQTAVHIQKPVSYASREEAAEALRGRFAVGMAHTVFLDGEGLLGVEGANDCGQCDLRGHSRIKAVAAGPYRSAAILDGGRILMCGRNTDGQCDAQALNRELDVMGQTGENAFTWQSVACGQNHTAALRSDGRVYTIGANPDGRCDTRQWREVTQIACGIRHTVARRSDGTCVAVGDNRYGQCNVADWTNVRLVAAGEFHTVALTDTGRVLAVGDNRSGECDLEDLQGIISVACLPEATVCVTAEGRVIIRGNGKLQVDSLENIVAVDTCEYRIAAMTMDGELICIP